MEAYKETVAPRTLKQREYELKDAESKDVTQECHGGAARAIGSLQRPLQYRAKVEVVAS